MYAIRDSLISEPYLRRGIQSSGSRAVRFKLLPSRKICTTNDLIRVRVLYQPFHECVKKPFNCLLFLLITCFDRIIRWKRAGLVDLGRFFSFLIRTQSVGLMGRGISPSQGRYLPTEQHRHRINAHRHLCLEWDSNPRSQCLRTVHALDHAATVIGAQRRYC
jgi:hypothetical protein